MSYGVRYRGGVAGLGVFNHYGLGYGFGDFNPPSAPSYEDCDPRDTACVERNQAKDVAYQQGILIAQASNDRDVCVSNAQQNPEPYQSQMMADCASRWPAGVATTVPIQNVPVSYLPAAFQTPAQAAATFSGSGPVSSGGSVAFTTSRGGSSFYPGDTWKVKISGATPGGQVQGGGGNNGVNTSTPYGPTDSNGNWERSGTFSANDVGQWQETWSVGGVPSGSFGFTVNPGTPAVVTSGGTVATVGPPAETTPGAAVSSILPAGFSLSDVPWWGWVVVAGVGFMAFGGKR